MFCVAGKNEKFIRLNFIRFVAKSEPAVSINAINQQVFGQAFFAVGVVVSCLRVITKAANKKGRRNFVGEHMRFLECFSEFQFAGDLFHARYFCKNRK